VWILSRGSFGSFRESSAGGVVPFLDGRLILPFSDLLTLRFTVLLLVYCSFVSLLFFC
jgi:hypothetical protein